MKYRDGRDARVGDRVQLWPGNCGTVVGAIDAAEYSAGYRREDWQHLGSGILIASDLGLFHYTSVDEEEDFELIQPAPG